MVMHGTDTVVFSIFLIFTGAAILSTAALYTRQSLLVAYMLVGAIFGPWGLKLVSDSAVVSQTGEIGIIFLLFLLGLHLHPQNLLHMLRKMTWIAVISSLVLMGVGFGIGFFFGYSLIECIIIGAAMMFSSTIIGLKLLPTTVLHHQHTGELVISILLMQDVIAIVVLLLLQGGSAGGSPVKEFAIILLAFPLLCIFAFVFEKYVLVKLFAKFDRIKEYTFLVSIAWCLSVAKLGSLIGLSDEIGAFIAGVSLAASPISLYIAESLKPLRDFFLVLFFFSIGASFNLNYLPVVFVPAMILAILMLGIKPVLYRFLLTAAKETKPVAWEVGVRLGQVSEFSLLVAYLAQQTKLISDSTSYLIQATTIITFIVSSYFVVLRYPTPIALSDKMRRD